MLLAQVLLNSLTHIDLFLVVAYVLSFQSVSIRGLKVLFDNFSILSWSTCVTEYVPNRALLLMLDHLLGVKPILGWLVPISIIALLANIEYLCRLFTIFAVVTGVFE